MLLKICVRFVSCCPVMKTVDILSSPVDWFCPIKSGR